MKSALIPMNPLNQPRSLTGYLRSNRPFWVILTAVLAGLASSITQRALADEPCYLRITNSMDVPITILFQGKDVVASKARQRLLDAKLYTLREKGEIFQSELRDGVAEKPLPPPIPAGGSTAWLGLGPYLLDAEQATRWKDSKKVQVINEGWRSFLLTVRPARLAGAKLPPAIELKLELTRSPQEPSYFQREVKRDSPALVLIVPQAGYREKAMLDEDSARLALDYLKGLDLPGQLPTRFYPHFTTYTTRDLPGNVRQLESDVVREMGNSPSYHSLHLYSPAAVKGNRAEQDATLAKLDKFWPGRQREVEVDVAKVVAAGEPLGVWISGEFHLNPADNKFLQDDPQEQQRFRDYLQAQGLQPDHFGWKSWEEARMQFRGDPGKLNPVVFWHSMQFRSARVGEFFAQTTHAVEKPTLDLPGAHRDRIWIGPYHSEGHVLGSNGYGAFMQGADWWSLERARQGNSIRSEDFPLYSKADVWFVSHQVIPLCLDYLWSTAKWRDETMVFDVTLGSGTVPSELRWRMYAALGRGVRVIDHEYHGPAYLQFTYAVQPHLATLNELARTYRRIATVEDLLADGRREDAPVAILHSQAAELWSGWPDLPARFTDQYRTERHMLYYALRHKGIPVEFIDDDIVEAGELKRYKVLYLSGRHLPRACADKIRQWVSEGGTLYSACASGLLDEYNRPNDTLLEVYGLTKATISGKARADGEQALLGQLRKSGAKLLDKMTLTNSALSFPAWEFAARLDARNQATVLARFSDGSPAMLRSRFGKGSCLVTGALLGLEYGARAADKKVQFGDRIPLDPAGKQLVHDYPFYFEDDPETYAKAAIATGFPTELRDLICQPIDWAGVHPRLQCNARLVDGVLLTGKQGLVVTLVNYGVDTLPELQVSVALEPGQQVETVWSTEQLKTIPFEQRDGRLTARLSLSLADMLGIRFKVAK